MKPLNNTGAEGITKGMPESPLEIQVEKLGLGPTTAGKPLSYSTNPESRMRWEGKTGFIDVSGGAQVPSGYSIKLNPEGENSVEYYRD